MAAILGNLSSTCTGALINGLSSGPFAQCADVTGLVGVVTTTGSIIEPLNSYLETFCPSPACTHDALANVTSVIQNGCSSDISSGAVIPSVLQYVVQNFDGIKATLCVERQSNSSYCLTEVLYNIQNATGTTLSITELEQVAAGGLTGLNDTLSSLPKSAYCTDCSSGLVTELLDVAAANLSSSEITSARKAAAGQCSNVANFGGPTLPTGIVTVNSTASANSTTSMADLD